MDVMLWPAYSASFYFLNILCSYIIPNKPNCLFTTQVLHIARKYTNCNVQKGKMKVDLRLCLCESSDVSY